MPNIRELTEDERAGIVAEQSCCQDGENAGPGDDDYEQDGGE